MKLHLERIEIPRGRRPLDQKAVTTIASSVKEIGLKTPISVRKIKRKSSDGDWEYPWILVAGRHRLAAAKKLGMKQIEVIDVGGDDIDASMWEIAENLHRAELSAQERADLTGTWVKKLDQRLELQAPVGSTPKASKRGRIGEGRRVSAITTAAKSLGVTHEAVRQRVQIAKITPAARAAADAAGLTSHKDRFTIASAPAERQVERVQQLARGERSNPISERWDRSSRAQRLEFLEVHRAAILSLLGVDDPDADTDVS